MAYADQMMAKSLGILIFNKNDRERRAMSLLMKTEENRVYDTADSLEALHLLQKENIAVILAGQDMGGIDRKEFKNIIEKLKPGVSVIFTSPFNQQDKEFSVNIEEFVRLVNDAVQKESQLYREVKDVKQFSHAIADRLLQIFAVNDRYFFNNDHMVSELSGRIAEKMGLEDQIVEAIQMAALLRDLGRVVIHQQILEETKKLNQAELIPVKAHPIHTMQILRHVRFPWNLDSIISQHHEHYDGSGYPMGLKGREITIGARIINVADAYYAMTTDRPYRKALPKHAAVGEIKRNAGGQFDPEVVEVFLSVVAEEPSEAVSKKYVLIFEREPNVAAMIKLGTTESGVEVLHATSSIDAISRIRQKNPRLIIADTDALEAETFVKFYHTALQTASHRNFLLIVRDRNFLNRFSGSVDYLLKPVNIDQITAKIKGMIYESVAHEPHEEVKGLTGSLEDFNLVDIIQILSLGLKTARVEVTRDGGKGMLYLLSGKIVHASVGELRGPDAFFELIRWNKGTFFILHGQMTSDINITLDTMRLLVEAIAPSEESKTDTPPHIQKISRIS